MPTFSDTVPDDPRGPSFPIVRTPTWKPLVAIVTSPNLVGCYTHYFKGRTCPCEKPDCEACQAGMPYRWHAYMSVLLKTDSLHAIFECTAQAATNFTDYRDSQGSLRGCRFEARRLNNKPNGRIIISCKPANLTEIQLPNPPDLTKCLAILWDFPIPDVRTGKINPEQKTRNVEHRPAGHPKP